MKNVYRILLGEVLTLQIGKLSVRVRSSEAKELRQKLEDKLALYLQRIIASARSRGVKHYDSEASKVYEEDVFERELAKDDRAGWMS